MFSSDIYGYNKNEVDKFISNLKAEHEKALMEEKLKVLEAEKKVLETKNKAQEIENRSKNIFSLLESYKKAQAEGSRNIDVLRGEQLRMVYVQLQSLLLDLNRRCPGVLVNSSYKKLITEIETILASTQAKKEEVIETGTENDPMRVLLSKMQGKKVQENPKEVRIERADTREFREKDKPSLIKPVVDMELSEEDNYVNLVDKFLNTQPPEEEPKTLKIQSTGFDLKEAVNPTDDLSEIMKAFDFYSKDSNDENN